MNMPITQLSTRAIPLFLAVAMQASLSSAHAAPAPDAQGSAPAVVECQVPSPLYVEAYAKKMTPAVGGLLLGSILVDNVEGELAGTKEGVALWNAASPEAKLRFRQGLVDKGNAIRLGMESKLAAGLKSKPARTCGVPGQYAQMPTTGPAADYIALEKATLGKAIGFAADGLMGWMILSSQQRAEVMNTAIGASEDLPPFPFSFDGRALFNTLVLSGVALGKNPDTAEWLAKVKETVTSKAPDAFHRSRERKNLTRSVSSTVNQAGRNLSAQDKDELQAAIKSATAELLALLVT